MNGKRRRITMPVKHQLLLIIVGIVIGATITSIIDYMISCKPVPMQRRITENEVDDYLCNMIQSAAQQCELKNVTQHVPFHPIFNTYNEVKDYREYIHKIF